MVEDKKVIFYDLAGHERYLRTTLFGMSSSYPHISLILVEANRGVQKMTKEHIITSLYLRIPFVFVITKMDVAQPTLLKKNIEKLKRLMTGIKKKIFAVKSTDDVKFVSSHIGSNLVPLFKISNVCGDNYDPPFHYITDFLHTLNVKSVQEEDKKAAGETVFIIDKSFRVHGFPMIGSGYMRRGRIDLGDSLFLGPVNGKFVEVSVRSMHDDNRNIVRYLRKDEVGCTALKVKNDQMTHKNQIRSGMILTSNKNLPIVRKFVARVKIFTNHHTTIKRGTNTMIHCGALRKAVVIDRISRDGKDLPCIRGGDDQVVVCFRFLQDRYFLEVDDLFIFREGNTRGSGVVTKLIVPDPQKNLVKP
jgi:GTPase